MTGIIVAGFGCGVLISNNIVDYLDIIDPLVGKLPIRVISKIFSKRTNMSTSLLYDYLIKLKQNRGE